MFKEKKFGKKIGVKKSKEAAGARIEPRGRCSALDHSATDAGQQITVKKMYIKYLKIR